MSSPTSTATPVKLPEEDTIASIKKMVANLQERYNDARLDDSDEGKKIRASVAGQLRRLPHDMIHPDEALVELDVPPAVTGEAFKINDVVYSGHVIVPTCVASTLLYMMDQNRKVDLERMRESGRTIDLGNIMQRMRTIQGE